MTKQTTGLIAKTTSKPSRSKRKERRLAKWYSDKRESQPITPKIAVTHKHGSGATISMAGETESEQAQNVLAILQAFGTTSQNFQALLMSELLDASCKGGKTIPYAEDDLNGVIAAMSRLQPKDEMEGMLISQMVATHFASMKSLRNMKNSDNIPQQDSNGNIAIKLMRTFTMQMEALNRYRGKGQQKMIVEHVHVHAGGQAIVGNITRPEGGKMQKSKEQPHAKQIAHALVETMPCQNAQSDLVPVAGDA